MTRTGLGLSRRIIYTRLPTSVVDNPNRSVWLDNAVVAFYYTVISALPLRFYVPSVQIFDTVAERIVRVLLKWGFNMKRMIHNNDN